MKYVIGIDIGGTSVKFGLFDENGVLQDKWSAPTETAQNGASILADCAAQTAGELARMQLPAEDLLGIGVGVPGPVTEERIVHGTPNLGWGTCDVVELLRKELAFSGLSDPAAGLRIRAANDADLAAFGEAAAGAGKQYRRFALITIGTGIGCGLIENGRIVTGSHGGAGELGHLKMTRDETRYCGCGKRGCLEQYAAAQGIVRTAETLLEEDKEKSGGGTHPSSPLSSVSCLTAKDVLDTAARGDPIAREAVRRAAEMLGTAISYLCSVFDPEAVLLGGGIAQAGKTILEPVRQYFHEAVYAPLRGTPVLPASLGPDAGITGAAHFALELSAP